MSSVSDIEDRIPSACRECRFFDDAPHIQGGYKMRHHDRGLCRRTAPTPLSGPADGHSGMGGWLMVLTTDWCGAGSTGIRATREQAD
jgi:hypothetical protein